MESNHIIPQAFKTSVPVIMGYIPAGFGFGLLLTALEYPFFVAPLMSLLVYAGAAQYLAIDFFTNNYDLIQIIMFTFLINSKHLFYGLSLIDDYKNTGLKKIYLIFALTDETYALLTNTKQKENTEKTKYCVFVSFFNHLGWIGGTLLGSVFGAFIKFNTNGLEFAMTALFIVILIDMLQSFQGKIPFYVGGFSALAAMLIFGKDHILLVGSILSVIILPAFKRRVKNI